jgi:ribosomal protein S8E
MDHEKILYEKTMKKYQEVCSESSKKIELLEESQMAEKGISLKVQSERDFKKIALAKKLRIVQNQEETIANLLNKLEMSRMAEAELSIQNTAKKEKIGSLVVETLKKRKITNEGKVNATEISERKRGLQYHEVSEDDISKQSDEVLPMTDESTIKGLHGYTVEEFKGALAEQNTNLLKLDSSSKFATTRIKLIAEMPAEQDLAKNDIVIHSEVCNRVLQNNSVEKTIRESIASNLEEESNISVGVKKIKGDLLNATFKEDQKKSICNQASIEQPSNSEVTVSGNNNREINSIETKDIERSDKKKVIQHSETESCCVQTNDQLEDDDQKKSRLSSKLGEKLEKSPPREQSMLEPVSDAEGPSKACQINTSVILTEEIRTQRKMEAQKQVVSRLIKISNVKTRKLVKYRNKEQKSRKRRRTKY